MTSTPASDDATPSVTCRNCGSAHVAQFCAACGQEVVSLDASTWHVVRDAIADATDLDGRVARTARALLSPGRLTLAYLRGQRVPYLGPVKLFLTAGTALTATWITTRGVDARFYALPAGADGSAATYIDAVVRGTLLAVAGVGAGGWTSTAGARRLLDCVVFALHLVAAMSLWASALIWLGTGWKALWGRHDAVPGLLPSLPYLLFLPAALAGVAYVALATRALLRGPWWATALRTVLFVAIGAGAVTVAIERSVRP